jgi:hypothetical protein
LLTPEHGWMRGGAAGREKHLRCLPCPEHLQQGHPLEVFQIHLGSNAALVGLRPPMAVTTIKLFLLKLGAHHLRW